MKNSKLFLILFLGILSGMGRFITDIYIPALPKLAEDYNVNISIVQLTLTGSMLGLGFGQLFIGPISDKYGRKKPIVFSLTIYILASILIIFSPNIYIIAALRFVQGFSAAGSVVISRAVAADVYSGKKLSRFFGIIMIVNGFVPILGPVLGSVLISSINWQSIFVVLTILGIILFMATFNFKETLSIDRRNDSTLVNTYLSIFDIIKNKVFISVVLVQSFSTAGLFSYISGSPFIMQQGYGVSSLMYSIFFGINGLGMLIGNFVSIRVGLKHSIKTSLVIMFINSIFISAVLILKWNLLFLELGFFILMFALGILFPAVTSVAMNIGKETAGSSSAVLGFLPFSFGGIVSPLVGIGNIYYASSIILIVSSFISLYLYVKISKKL
ncbi:multidrug effflux MFS transporter [Gemelliphila palaticanis]|uniref:Bcr/CflA family efflux transporter n=1 Tax=Gemelliphila palaticanis TaxID=81950 RepID=A0ABX2SXN3_9BACL|nr:multidrug effflux MFS transporter [Gemella palaticanis]MBF0714787.1 multidrug effflux MFS transporter [Gemella palaticanis]NYS46717.1 multidrug effflux MFS transporter [Gemella palaticanis]